MSHRYQSSRQSTRDIPPILSLFNAIIGRTNYTKYYAPHYIGDVNDPLRKFCGMVIPMDLAFQQQFVNFPQSIQALHQSNSNMYESQEQRATRIIDAIKGIEDNSKACISISDLRSLRLTLVDDWIAINNPSSIIILPFTVHLYLCIAHLKQSAVVCLAELAGECHFLRCRYCNGDVLKSGDCWYGMYGLISYMDVRLAVYMLQQHNARLIVKKTWKDRGEKDTNSVISSLVIKNMTEEQLKENVPEWWFITDPSEQRAYRCRYNLTSLETKITRIPPPTLKNVVVEQQDIMPSILEQLGLTTITYIPPSLQLNNRRHVIATPVVPPMPSALASPELADIQHQLQQHKVQPPLLQTWGQTYYMYPQPSPNSQYGSDKPSPGFEAVYNQIARGVFGHTPSGEVVKIEGRTIDD